VTTASPALVPAPIHLREKERAPAALIAVALVAAPLLKPHGPAHVTPADVLMAVGIVAAIVWAGSNAVRVHLPYIVSVGIMVVSGLIAALFSIVPVSGFIAIGQDVFLLLWAAAIANLVRVPKTLSVFLSAWSFGAIAWASLLVLAVATGLSWLAGGSTFGVRAQLWFDNPNMAGNFFMVSLFVLMLSERPYGRLARAGGFAVVGAAVLLTGSVAALGAFVIGAGVTAVFALWRRSDLITAVAMGAVVTLVIGSLALVTIEAGGLHAVQNSSNTLVERSVGRASRSAAGRANLFSHEFELFLTGSLMGRGPASTKANLALTYGDVVKEAHDDYLATLTERGVLGVIGLLLFIVGVGIRASAVSRGRLSEPYAGIVRVPSALIGGAVALAISAITHEILHYRHVWAFFGLLAGLYLFGRVGAEEQTTAPSGT
jgi:hypothetical protein